MKERPILFSAPMVRAILAGTKTQTRRAVKLPHENRLGVWEPTRFGGPTGGRTAFGKTIPEQGGIWHTRTGDHLACPYGQSGDRLWVRETWAAPHSDDARPPRFIHCDWTQIHYAATEERGGLLWRPSIHMPRWASRITLEITSVRVERLQDITNEDARAEGVLPEYAEQCVSRGHPYTAIPLFLSLWSSVNGTESLAVNPWVWVVEFKRVEGEAA
jgi:hypothetical protein